jgi:hypothetical protein
MQNFGKNNSENFVFRSIEVNRKKYIKKVLQQKNLKSNIN